MVQSFSFPIVALAIALSAHVFLAGHPASARPVNAASTDAFREQMAQSKQVDESTPGDEDSDADSPGVDEIDVSTVDPVSDEELSQFAVVLLSLQTLQDSYREQALSAVQAEGLSAERFDQILVLLRSPQSPEVADVPEVTPEESMQFERALSQIGAIQESIQGQMRQAILDEGLEIDRFQEIAAVVNSDQELEERVRQMMESTAPTQG